MQPIWAKLQNRADHSIIHVPSRSPPHIMIIILVFLGEGPDEKIDGIWSFPWILSGPKDKSVQSPWIGDQQPAASARPLQLPLLFPRLSTIKTRVVFLPWLTTINASRPTAWHCMGCQASVSGTWGTGWGILQIASQQPLHWAQQQGQSVLKQRETTAASCSSCCLWRLSAVASAVRLVGMWTAK